MAKITLTSLSQMVVYSTINLIFLEQLHWPPLSWGKYRWTSYVLTFYFWLRVAIGWFRRIVFGLFWDRPTGNFYFLKMFQAPNYPCRNWSISLKYWFVLSFLFFLSLNIKSNHHTSFTGPQKVVIRLHEWTLLR